MLKYNKIINIKINIYFKKNKIIIIIVKVLKILPN